jgi:V8-like Glu-specific endopeptidase
MRRLVLCAVLAAGCGNSPHIVAARHAIIGGTRDTGDPAVVMLVSYPTNLSTFYTCTAALISPTVLVTAAHCVDAGQHAGDQFGVFFGDDASSYATTAALAAVLGGVSGVYAHPSYDPSPPYTADIAVAILSQAQTIAPLPIERTPLTAATAGQTARIVGYGQTQYGQYNVTKYQASTVIASVGTDDTITVGDAQHRTCVGDSGGPALVMLGGVETIVGVDSYTDTTGCTQPAHDRRVGQYTAFLDGYTGYVAPDMGGATADLGSAGDASDLGGGAGDLGDAGNPAGTRDLAPLGDPRGVHPSASGCTMTGGRSAGSPWLLALALFLWRRRFRA